MLMNLGVGISFLIVLLIITLIFFSKKTLSNYANKMFKILIITTIIGLLIEILCTGASFIHNDFTFISNFLLKTYLVYIITWASLFTVYIYFISHEEEQIIKFENKNFKTPYL